MIKRLHGKNWNLFKNRYRLISCVALGLYVFALVVLPGLHGHGCDHPVETCCEHSESTPDLPDSDDACPICEFAVLAVPFLTASDPLLWQPDTVSEISFTLSIPPVADATDLPPCRAPPIV